MWHNESIRHSHSAAAASGGIRNSTTHATANVILDPPSCKLFCIIDMFIDMFIDTFVSARAKVSHFGLLMIDLVVVIGKCSCYKGVPCYFTTT